MGEKRGLKALQAWCRKVTEGYKNVTVSDMSMSWKDGLAFCAIIHHYRPDLVDFDSLTKENILLNNRLAFTVAEQSLGIPALLDAEDMVRYAEPDKLSIATYVSQYYQFFEGRNRGTASNNLHTNKLSLKRPFNERAFAPQALPAKIAGVAPRGFFKDDKCSVCANRVFILERLMVDAKLYHRTCFLCNKCQTILRPGAYATSDEEGKFECIECPRDEKASSPVEEDKSVKVELVAVTENQDSVEDPEKVLVGLKLSNSFINARKKFFEESLEKPSPSPPEEESLKLTISNNVLHSNVLSPLDEGLTMKNTSYNRIEIDLENSGKKEQPYVDEKFESNDNVSDIKVDKSVDVTTPVKPVKFDIPGTMTQSETQVAPDLPTSKVPDMEETITTEVPLQTPPQKTPRKTKRLSVDVSSLSNEASALPPSSSGSMSPSISLPVITSTQTTISSLKRDSSSTSLKTVSTVSKPTKPILPLTKLTSPEQERKSVELKGCYQSPLSPGSRWKRESSELKSRPVSVDSLPSEKPKIPNKPATLMKPVVPIEDAIDPKQNTPKDGHQEVEVRDKPPDADEEKSSEVIVEVRTKSPDEKSPEVKVEVKDKPPEVDEEKYPEAEVKVEVRAKPARPPKPVIKSQIEEKPKPKLEYSDDLNPFGDDDETPEDEEYPDDLNPFGDDEEPSTSGMVEDTSLQSISSQSVSKGEDYDSKLNPFGDSDNEETNFDTRSLSKNSHLSFDYSNVSLPSTPRSSSRQSRAMGTLKKRPAPLPPSLLPGGRDYHQSELNLCSKGSPSPSRRSLRGSPSLRKKAAPKPPIPPPPLASTPKPEQKETINQDLKALKEQNNKTVKELNINPPDLNDDDDETKEANTFGYWKKKKRPAPSVPIPPRRQIKMMPVKEIQSELLEIEDKQQDLEIQGRDLEMMIRDLNQGDETDATIDEEELILQLFELVNQKNILFRRQAELMYIKRSQSLELEQADIEYQYRLIASKPEKLKSEEERKREDNLLQRLIEIVELRNEIVESMDMDRQRVQDEDTSIQEQMAQRQGQLQERMSPDATSVSEQVEEVEVKKEKKKHKLKLIKRDKSKDPKDKKDKKEKKEKTKEAKKPKNKEEESLWKFVKKDKKEVKDT